MFLCKRVRSEMGVDSVGVGGGEPGGPAGGALRLVVTCPSTSPPVGPARVGGRVLHLWRAGRPGGPSGVADPPATAVRAAASSEEIVAAPLGGPRGSVAGRLDRVGGAEVTRRRAGGKARKAVFLSQALSRARRRGRVLAGPGRTGGRRPGPVGRPPRRGRCRLGRRAAATPLRSLVGDEPHGGADQVDHAGGDHGVGPGRLDGLGQAGRPVAFPRALRSQAGAPPLRSARPGRAPVGQFGAHAAPFKEAPPRPLGSRSPARAQAPSMPRTHGDAGSGVPGTRWSGADHRRGLRPRWITG